MGSRRAADRARPVETICLREGGDLRQIAPVLTRHVLAALDAGIAANDDDAARTALAGIDPVARGFARRKLGRALIDAELVAEGKPPAHVMRVAALAVAGRSVPVDADRVEAAYAELPKPAMPRLPLWTIAAALIVLALAGGIAFAIVTRPGPAARTYHRPMPPPSADAFTKGGVPRSPYGRSRRPASASRQRRSSSSHRP